MPRLVSRQMETVSLGIEDDVPQIKLLIAKMAILMRNTVLRSKYLDAFPHIDCEDANVMK